MKYNQLGRTGLFVSEICLGGGTFGGESGADTGMWKAIGDLGQAQVDAIVSAALAAGVNFIDTADIYSFGQSERLLGQALKNLGVARKDVVIGTKVCGEMSAGPNDRGASRAHIMDSVQASLERLQTDHIDLYQLHSDDPVTPIDETLRALDDLISQGLVRYTGVSNWAAWKISQALGISAVKGYARFDCLQAYYSLVGRDLEREIVPMLNSEGLGLTVWSPLAGGLLTGKIGPGSPAEAGTRQAVFSYPPVDEARAWPCIAALSEVGEAHGVSVARVALAWLLAQPHVTSVIIGVKTTAQLADNIAAANLVLTAEDMARLDAVSALPSEYPGWILQTQAAGRYPKPFAPGDRAKT